MTCSLQQGHTSYPHPQRVPPTGAKCSTILSLCGTFSFTRGIREDQRRFEGLQTLHSCSWNPTYWLGEVPASQAAFPHQACSPALWMQRPHRGHRDQEADKDTKRDRKLRAEAQPCEPQSLFLSWGSRAGDGEGGNLLHLPGSDLGPKL